MATITPTSLRPPVKHHANTFLSVLQPAVLLQALINNASIARGGRTVAYDTGTGSAAGYAVIAAAVANGVADNIGTALMVEIETSTGTELVRVKSITGNAVSGTLTLAEHAVVLADNLVIRIKHFFQVIPVPPAIRSGVFYKDFDRAFSSAFATTPNPVAICGPHLAGFLSAGSIAFSLNSSSSYAIANGASISSRVWACVHNGGATTGIGFSSTTAANPTLTITEVGTYWLSLTVTDSNGRTQTTYRAIFVYDSSNLPYTDFTIDNLSGDWDSGQWRCNLTLTGDQTLTDIPDGTLAVVWYQNYFDGVEGYVNMWSPFGNNIIYTGYLWSDNDSDNLDNGTGRASFEVISPLQYLDSITDYGTVSLEAKTSPALWSDYASWLTVGRGIHHLLKWDTTILEVVDVGNLLGNTYGVKVLEFTEDTLLQRINGVAYQRGVHVKLLCNRIGQLYLSTDSQMLNTANRAALDTVFTITNNDISGGVNIVRNNTDVRAFADMDGFTYSHPTSTPFISMIPGYIESLVSYNLPEFRGVGVATDKQQVLNPAGGQTDCNERVGRRLALENVSPKEIRVDMRGCYLGAFDIVPREGWHGWSVNNAALKRELNLSGILTVCRAVSHRFGYEENKFTGVIQTVGVVLQPEAKGPDGTPGNYPTTYPAITTPAPPSYQAAASTTPPPDGTSGFFLLVYDSSSSTGSYSTVEGYAVVGEADNLPSDPSFGTPVLLSTSVRRPMCAALSSTKALAAWVDGDENGVVGLLSTVTGTLAVSLLGSEQFDTDVNNLIHVNIIPVSDEKAIIWYSSGNAGPYAVKACVVTVTGSTLEIGSPVTVKSSDDSIAAMPGHYIDSTKAIVQYNSVEFGVKALILTVSGSTVTLGTEAEIFATYLNEGGGAIALSTTVGASVYTRSSIARIKALTLSGNSISAVGSEVNANADNTDINIEFHMPFAKINSNKLVVLTAVDVAGLSEGPSMNVVDVTGTTVTTYARVSVGGAGGDAPACGGYAIARMNNQYIASEGFTRQNPLLGRATLSGTTLTAEDNYEYIATGFTWKTCVCAL